MDNNFSEFVPETPVQKMTRERRQRRFIFLTAAFMAITIFLIWDAVNYWTEIKLLPIMCFIAAALVSGLGVYHCGRRHKILG